MPDENQEPDFPVAELARLDEMINRRRWIVPVLPKHELEVLLEASIKLCKKGLDLRSEPCQRFIQEGLRTSFTKIMTVEAIRCWKYEIQKCIHMNTKKLVELCIVKLPQDCFPLLDLLAMVFDPQCKFHFYTRTQPSESVPASLKLADDALFARPPDPSVPRILPKKLEKFLEQVTNHHDSVKGFFDQGPILLCLMEALKLKESLKTLNNWKGWLVDLVNTFGQLDGFQVLFDRFTNGSKLSAPVIAALVRPFGQCAELLTPYTIQKYFMPIVVIAQKMLDSLTDDELKKESSLESNSLFSIVKIFKQFAYRLPNKEEIMNRLEIFRLTMIHRLLRICPISGKMNALNELDEVIAESAFQANRQASSADNELLTADEIAEWIQRNNVVSIVLQDGLHEPQFVEKIEKILRFMIMRKSFSVQDLYRLWHAQSGKGDAVVKTLHAMLARLALDFTSEQLDHLFECFKVNWAYASKKQQNQLLQLISKLIEDDTEGIMDHKPHKVRFAIQKQLAGLLWNLAHSEDVPTDIMVQALAAQIKILGYSSNQDGNSQKMNWITRFIEDLENDKWVLPALKQLRKICQLFPERPNNVPQNTQRTSHVHYKDSVINIMQNNHMMVMMVTQNLSDYMNRARTYAKDHPEEDPSSILPDGRFNHVLQVQERLEFIRFLLRAGQLWLCGSQALKIWQMLVENPIYTTDREICFKWFAKIMGAEPDLDPDIALDFFMKNILQLDTNLLTENGMNCFERFFRNTSVQGTKLLMKRQGVYLMEDVDLVGFEYLWKVVMWSKDEVAEKAIVMLKDICTNLGPKLLKNQRAVHEDFVQSTVARLEALLDTVHILEKDKDRIDSVTQEANRMVRVITVLKEYVAALARECGEQRACHEKLPQVTLIVRSESASSQVDDIEVWSHAIEQGAVRRPVLMQVKASTNVKVDLYINGENLGSAGGKRITSQIPLREIKMIITAELISVVQSIPSGPDSSSDRSTGLDDEANSEVVEYDNSVVKVQVAPPFNRRGSASRIMGLGSKMEADILHCTICLELFTEPKLLPCFHTFCAKCLQNHIDKSKRGIFFHCPICRTVTTVPQKGADGYQTNFYISGRGDTVEQTENHFCEICGVDVKATHHCLDCEENFCTDCTSSHMKMSRHHKLLDLNASGPDALMKIKSLIVCAEHPREEVKVYCQQCDKFLC